MIKKKLNRIKDWYCHYGFKLLILKLLDRPQKDSPGDYIQWMKKYGASREDLEKQREEIFEDKVTISIAVPLFHTPENYLRAMIESVQKQSYKDWELCMTDGSKDDRAYNVVLGYAKEDNRIKIQKLGENLGIAENTNLAIAMCTGEYIGLLDHDDTLAPETLYEIRKAIEKNGYPEVIYTDEDKISVEGEIYFAPHFKSDFNKDLLRSNNYICHFFVAQRSLLCQVGGLRKEFEGAQDYDLILRCTESANNIIHIDRPLYHWRSHMSSTAENPESKLFAYENGKKAIEAHLKRQGEKGCVAFTNDWGFYHVRYKVRKHDKVTIIVFGDDFQSHKLTKRCIKSIKRRPGYDNYNILVIDELTDLEKCHIEGEYVLLVNNTISLITHNWLSELLGCCQRKEVGAVGIKLYNRNETVRHAGIINGMKKYAFEGMPRVRSGYFHRDSLLQNLSAVTVDFFMISREMFETVVKEDSCALSNERKLCERIRKHNRLIVYDPGVEAYISGRSSRSMFASKQRDEYYNKNVMPGIFGYKMKV